MKLLRPLTLLAFAAVACLVQPARAQVEASLVSAVKTIQPGQPFTVALRLQHEPHWHTYWVNPGTGLATNINWDLPAGFSAGPIQWPAPVVLKDRVGNVIGNGYEGDQLIPVTITPPEDLKAGQTITLHAAVDWLMCEDVCMPGDAKLELSLPVTNTSPATNGKQGERINEVVAGLPAALDNWRVTASRAEKTITLTVTPSGEASHTPTGLHFFADDNLVAYEAAQTVKPDGAGGFVLTLAISPDGPQDATRLTGVLTSEKGWRADGSLRGLRVDVPFTASAPASSANTVAAPAGDATFAGTLFIAFIGGLVLNLMPCVFPVLGIKILGFVKQSGSDRKKVIGHGLVFTLGVLVSFWALASLLLVLIASGQQLGWGFQLQSPGFVFGMAVFLLVFALNLSGLFEVGLSATGAGANLQSKEGYLGSFFTGLLATLVATPCSAPYLATALPAALAMPALEAMVAFTFIALGLSTPYLLLSIFPQAVKILPKPGAWMETFKQFMAFPLYATVGWLLWVLAAQTAAQDTALRNIVFGLVLVAMAAWIYGRFGQAHGKAGRRAVGYVLAGLLLTGGVWFGWPAESTANAETSSSDAYNLTWHKWSPEAVAAARAEGRTIYVDFTARWCFTCQTNKAAVFSSDRVQAEFARRNVLLLKADWTSKDPQITAELEKYQRRAVPFNVIWLPGKSEPVILPELLTAGTVLDALP